MKPSIPGKRDTLETRISLALLAVLVIAGVGVYLRQFTLNPAVLALRPESQQAVLPEKAHPAALLDTTGSGLIPFSPPEHFGTDTLYEKIDGRADLYLSSGFISLSTQRFAPDHTDGRWVEAFVYDMATPENAFSVFSRQRRQDAQADDTGPNAYRTENALFMAHGKFYLELIGTDDSDALHQAMGSLARLFVDAHGGRPAVESPGADRFPADGLQTGTVQLIATDAFGYEQLDRVFTAEYRIDGARLTAFVSDRGSDASASRLADEYRQTLLSYGAAAVDAPPPVDGAAVLQVFDTYEIIFSRGPYLSGVHEAADLRKAGDLAARLAAHLDGAAGK